ncbi:MAG TPA: phage tail protein [Pyrinomonadaceae bacterium]
MSEQYYPPGAFYFTVKVFGSALLLSAITDIDGSFQEVSGIQSAFETEEVVEGGENRYVHRLPRITKYSNLVLKRGIVTTDSFLSEWAGLTVGSSLALPVITQNLLVSLLNESGWPSIVWAFFNAYPVRWEVGAMNSEQNQILTETLEFSYTYFERVVLGSPLSAAAKLAALTARLA